MLADLTNRLREVIREGLFHLRKAQSRLPLSVAGPSTADQLVVVIPSYHEDRARNLDPIVRSALQCTFVARVIVSNHNPKVRLGDWISVEDERAVRLEYGRRYGCGHVWTVAAEDGAPHVLVIDDDHLLSARQIAVLFGQLLAHPEVPHGLSGALRGRYHERCEMEVDSLYNLYAVTSAHLRRYQELARTLELSCGIPHDDIEYAADDLLISHAGAGLPRIHDAGFVLRCRTGQLPGVATFKQQDFEARRQRVAEAIASIAPGRPDELAVRLLL